MDETWLYLDYNATTPMDDEVVAIMQDCLNHQAHPSSSHPHGQMGKAFIESARLAVSTALGCQNQEVLFCSGSTEASNHVIKGVCFEKMATQPKMHFISSEVDHAATLEPLKFLQRLGHDVTLLKVDSHGPLNPQDVLQAIRPDTVLVTLIHGQNEVGTVQPLEEVGSICREKGVLFHVDASQSFGKVEVNVHKLNADFLNIAGHKIYGPKGVGALFARTGCRLEPLLHGGGHESGWRSGTPAVPLIAGLGKACELVVRDGLVPGRACELIWQELTNTLGDHVVRNGHPTKRLPNVLHLTFHNVDGSKLLQQAKISASTGAACHSAAVSPVLQALGFKSEQAVGSVRLSTGRSTTDETAQKAARSLCQAHEALTAKSKLGPNHLKEVTQ